MENWTLPTNHARVLLAIAGDPGIRLRDIATTLGITERSACAIVTDLTEAGYVIRHKDGRRNRYQIQGRLLLPGPASNPPSASCSTSSPASARPRNTADRRPPPARWLASGLAASLPRTPGHVLRRSHEQQAPNGSDQVRSLLGPLWSSCCPWPRRGRVPRSACLWTSTAPGMAATTSRPTCRRRP